MIIDSDKVIIINKDSISEILIINYDEVWREITFKIKLIDNDAYLFPCRICYELSDAAVDIKPFTVSYYNHRKLYSTFYIKKLISRLGLVFTVGKFNDRHDTILQKIIV